MQGLFAWQMHAKVRRPIQWGNIVIQGASVCLLMPVLCPVKGALADLEQVDDGSAVCLR